MFFVARKDVGFLFVSFIQCITPEAPDIPTYSEWKTKVSVTAFSTSCRTLATFIRKIPTGYANMLLLFVLLIFVIVFPAADCFVWGRHLSGNSKTSRMFFARNSHGYGLVCIAYLLLQRVKRIKRAYPHVLCPCLFFARWNSKLVLTRCALKSSYNIYPAAILTRTRCDILWRHILRCAHHLIEVEATQRHEHKHTTSEGKLSTRAGIRERLPTLLQATRGAR